MPLGGPRAPRQGKQFLAAWTACFLRGRANPVTIGALGRQSLLLATVFLPSRFESKLRFALFRMHL